MIAYEFPPANTTGNYRSAGFARALLSSGNQVGVISIDEKEIATTLHTTLDSNLMQGLDNVQFLRLATQPLKNWQKHKIAKAISIWWNTTDKLHQRLFSKSNQKRINDFLQNFKPDVIYVSLPPFSAAYLASYITDYCKKPLVVDMRDGWSLWGASPFQTKWHYKKILSSETALFNKANAIIAVTPEFEIELQQQHPNIDKKKFHTIFNGYDTLSSLNENSSNLNDGTIRIGYIGSFYYNPENEKNSKLVWYKRPGLKKLNYYHRQEQWSYRSPYFFLKTLQLFLQENNELTNKIIFELVGNEPEWLKQMIVEMGLEKNYKHHGFVSKKEVINILETWNAVLATSEKIVNGNHFSLPSKIFDAIATKKPILAFTTNGSLHNFLKNYPQTIFCNPDDINNSVKRLKKFFENPNIFNSKPLDKSFDRNEQSKQLEKIFNNLVNS